MKIKMITTMAGPDGVFPAGTVCEIENIRAVELIKGGYAEPVLEGKRTAEIRQPERTVGKGQKKEVQHVAENPES